MKPLHMASLIILVTVLLSTAIVAELSHGYISSRLFASSSLPAQMVSSVGDPGYVPPISMGEISVEQTGSDVGISFDIISSSGSDESVMVRIMPFPSGLFSQQSKSVTVPPGTSRFSITVSGISGTGYYRISAVLETLSGVQVAKADTFKYFSG